MADGKNIPRLLLAAPRSGSGKTLITCGFLEVLKRRGIRPVSYKCGPDYIDPMFHKYVLGVSGGNLDSFFLSGEQVRQALKPAEMTVIEGVMGYYDGLGGISTEASSYEIAKITDTPAVLVLDCRGASLSLAATVKGFMDFKEDSRICGVLLNRMPPALCDRLIPVLEREGVRVFGYVPESDLFRLESRHLGLFMPEEVEKMREMITALAVQMEKTVDIDGLLAAAGAAGRPEGGLREAETEESPAGDWREAETEENSERNSENPEGNPENPEKTSERNFERRPGNTVPRVAAASPLIGVARDEAFCFYYQENLRLMEVMGARLVYFSPLHDERLPEGLDGLLLGGGYPENFAEALSENTSMLASVREAAAGNLPILAECGGFLYLHRSLTGSDGRKYGMAGVIDADAYPAGRLVRFGYVTLRGRDGRWIKGHEFHYWESSDPGDRFTAEKPVGGRSWRCMHERGNLLCGFPHLYYPSNPEFLREWMDRCGGETENENTRR